MQFKDNFSETLLVAEQPVIFYSDDPYLIKTINIPMRILTTAEIFIDPYVQIAISIMFSDIKDLKQKAPMINAETNFQFLTTLLKTGVSTAEHGTDVLTRSIEYCFNKLFGSSFCRNNGIWKIDKFELTEDWYNRIVDILKVSICASTFGELEQKKIKKPQWMIDKENELKRVKANANQAANSAHKDFVELSKILISINYEFGYTFEEQFNMNYFHLLFLAGYVSKAVNYDVSKRQVFSKKKIKYITDN